MKKLSEYKDEEAIELLADIMEPTAAIFADDEVVKEYRGGNTMAAIQKALKKHAKKIMQIMATIEGVPLSEYHCNVLALPKTILEIISDPELQGFFSSLASTEETESSGDATETITETESE